MPREITEEEKEKANLKSLESIPHLCDIFQIGLASLQHLKCFVSAERQGSVTAVFAFSDLVIQSA